VLHTVREHLEPFRAGRPLSETSLVLAIRAGASVQGRVALGPRAGGRVRRLGDEPDLGHVASRGPRQALYTNVWLPHNDAPASNRTAAISSAPR